MECWKTLIPECCLRPLQLQLQAEGPGLSVLWKLPICTWSGLGGWHYRSWCRHLGWFGGKSLGRALVSSVSFQWNEKEHVQLWGGKGTVLEVLRGCDRAALGNERDLTRNVAWPGHIGTLTLWSLWLHIRMCELSCSLPAAWMQMQNRRSQISQDWGSWYMQSPVKTQIWAQLFLFLWVKRLPHILFFLLLLFRPHVIYFFFLLTYGSSHPRLGLESEL